MQIWSKLANCLIWTVDKNLKLLSFTKETGCLMPLDFKSINLQEFFLYVVSFFMLQAKNAKKKLTEPPCTTPRNERLQFSSVPMASTFSFCLLTFANSTGPQFIHFIYWPWQSAEIQSPFISSILVFTTWSIANDPWHWCVVFFSFVSLLCFLLLWTFYRFGKRPVKWPPAVTA